MNNQMDIPVAPAKHDKMSHVVYPFYENLHQDFTPCLLDADFQWYKNSGADNFFNQWNDQDYDKTIKRSAFFDPGGNRPGGGDLLAYYVPIFWALNPGDSNCHKSEENFYGIHFRRGKMIQAAKQALGVTGENKLGVLNHFEEKDRWIPYCVFFQNILAHEFCHGWVEDLVCLFDPSKYSYNQGVNREEAIRSEEALCETVAYAWMCNFLETTPLKKNQKKILRERIRVWMREGLPGYKNFSEQNEIPLKSEKLLVSKDGLPAENLDQGQDSFQIGFIPLLRDVFGIKNYKIKNPIPIYFNYGPTANQSNLNSVFPRPGTPQYAATMSENRYWRGCRVPIFWHD